MKKYKIAAMGGTFDIVHNGHLELLSRAFAISSHVIIGLTSDQFCKTNGKIIHNNYPDRFENLKTEISKNFPNTSYEISELENDFGPAVLLGDVEVLVVSQETSKQGEILNKLREEKNLSKVDVIVVPMTLAEDGTRISTTRIKDSEITKEGKVR